MSDLAAAQSLAWADACSAAAICAVDPGRIGGIWLRARYGPTRDAWLRGAHALFGDQAWRRLPAGADDVALFGGLDIAASLSAGRAIVSVGVLAQAAGGVVELPGAERCSQALAARVAMAMDRADQETAFAVVALDESASDDERAPDTLSERLALHIALDDIARADRDEAAWPLDRSDILAARDRLADVVVDESIIEAVCETAVALGIVSLRAPVAAVNVARIAAALDGRAEVASDDVALAARLVLAPRARQWPSKAASDEDHDSPDGSDHSRAADQEERGAPDENPPEADDRPGDGPSDSNQHNTSPDAPDDRDQAREPSGAYQDVILEAAEARVSQAMQADLDDRSARPPRQPSEAGGGRRGAAIGGGRRGRPAGTRAGLPDAHHRLDLMATLRAAAPWQTVRGRSPASPRLRIRADDFRVRRYVQPEETATLFVVDASGSSALHRLAETKGAIELLLVDCYVRRDRVGLIAFRGREAETLLPPTRSLTHARRALAALPGGGPTPLASGLDAATDLAGRAARDGLRPRIVLLTDGRGNIARDGQASRAAAERDVALAASVLRAAGHTALLIDTSPRPRLAAEKLAAALGARYVPLPQAAAQRLSETVRREIDA